MNKTTNRPLTGVLSQVVLLGISCIALATPSTLNAQQAATPSNKSGAADTYLEVYLRIKDGEKLENDKKPKEALREYERCVNELQRIKKTYPTWRPEMVNHRITQLQKAIRDGGNHAALNKKTKAPAKATQIPEIAKGSPLKNLQALENSIDQIYLKAYLMLQKARKHEAEGDFERARKSYQSAADLFLEIQKDQPAWNPSMVKYRVDHTHKLLAALPEVE